MTYYNTTNESGEQLKEYKEKSLSQNEKITRFFIQRKGQNFTPSEILSRCFSPLTPLTSIRRSMSNLTKEGYLKQIDLKRMGIYGRKENCWTWNH